MKMNTTCAALALTLGLGAAANAAVIVGTTYTFSTATDADAAFYQDDSGSELTDGLTVSNGQAVANPDGTLGWAAGTAVDIDFDLGGTYDVDTVTIGAVGSAAWGKYAAGTVAISGSTDGTNFVAITIDSQDGFFLSTAGGGVYDRADNNVNLGGTAGFTHLRVSFDGSLNDGGAAGANGYLFDEITLDGTAVAAVPEPSSTALLGLGGLALILRRRK